MLADGSLDRLPSATFDSVRNAHARRSIAPGPRNGLADHAEALRALA